MKVLRVAVAAAAGAAVLAGCGSSSSGGSSASPSASATSSATSAASNPDAIASTRANLTTLASVEETYLTDNGSYTADSGGLQTEGFSRGAGTDSEILLAGVDGAKGYCLVGGASSGGPWFLYDSAKGGLNTVAFTSQSTAEGVCSDPKVTKYQTIS